MKRKRSSQPTDSPSSNNQLFAHKRLAERIIFKEMVKLRHDDEAACSKKCGALAFAAISFVIICM
jgi:hypothetical protein